MSSGIPNFLPGMEPENIQTLLKSFFGELDEYFSDNIIVWSEWNHERWDKAAGYLCKTLGYTRGKDFLEAYGYQVVQDRSQIYKKTNDSSDRFEAGDYGSEFNNDSPPITEESGTKQSSKSSNTSKTNASIVKCKKCGSLISDKNVKFCPNCGHKLKKSHPILVILLAFLPIILIFNYYSNEQKGSLSSTTVTVAPKSESNYKEEITFQDFPWGMSITEISSRLNEDYFESMTPGWSNADEVTSYSEYALGYRLFSIGDQQIAGYKVLNFSMYSMYGHKDGRLSTEAADSNLYLVNMNFDVVDVEGTYEDLYKKLENLYGEPKVSSHTVSTYSLPDGAYKSLITSAEWKGQNNTGVMLSKSVPEQNAPDSADNFNRYVALSYGKTDSDAMLSSIYKEYKENVAIKEKNSRDSTNSSGL